MLVAFLVVPVVDSYPYLVVVDSLEVELDSLLVVFQVVTENFVHLEVVH